MTLLVSRFNREFSAYLFEVSMIKIAFRILLLCVPLSLFLNRTLFFPIIIIIIIGIGIPYSDEYINVVHRVCSVAQYIERRGYAIYTYIALPRTRMPTLLCRHYFYTHTAQQTMHNKQTE